MAWLIEDDDDPIVPNASPGPSRSIRQDHTDNDYEPLFLASSPVPVTSPPRLPSDDEKDPVFLDEPPIFDSPPRGKGKTVRISPPKRSFKTDMGPPALPARIAHASPSASDDWPPEPTFAVRAPGRNARKRVASEVIDIGSSPLAPPPLSQRRLQRERPRSPSPVAADESPVQPPRKKKRKFQDAADAQRHNPWIDLEATHSGDELSAGPSDADTVLDSDDQFLAEPGETQIDPAYDQTAIYRQSLLTQVPGGAGPRFASRPVRRGRAAFGPNRAGPSGYGYRRGRSSSPMDDDEPDEYVTGSFVVDDDAEISFMNEGSSDL